MTDPLPQEWMARLGDEFDKDYMRDLSAFLNAEKAKGKRIFPRPNQFFRALQLTKPDEVKVVILGQDPYHGEGQAEGLSFSVPEAVSFPPSLLNIFKELASDVHVNPPKSGHLGHWARQGVLLLNSVLSVEAHQAASHAGKGWEQFTDRVIEEVNAGAPTVFLLWGAYAKRKAEFVDAQKHKIIASPHPSPLSAHRGFFGSKPFSQANAFLEAKGRGGIDWGI